MNGFYIAFFFVFIVNEDIININNNKDVMLLYQDLINVSLKHSRCIGQSKRHHLVLEIAVTGHESCILFTTFLDFHLIIDPKVMLGGALSLTEQV